MAETLLTNLGALNTFKICPGFRDDVFEFNYNRFNGTFSRKRVPRKTHQCGESTVCSTRCSLDLNASYFAVTPMWLLRVDLFTKTSMHWAGCAILCVKSLKPFWCTPTVACVLCVVRGLSYPFLPLPNRLSELVAAWPGGGGTFFEIKQM